MKRTARPPQRRADPSTSTPAPSMTTPGLNHAESLWVAYFLRRQDEGFAAVRGIPPTTRARVLAMVRYAAPRAYDVLTAAQPVEQVLP
jgi:hypothetical protein